MKDGTDEEKRKTKEALHRIFAALIDISPAYHLMCGRSGISTLRFTWCQLTCICWSVHSFVSRPFCTTEKVSVPSHMLCVAKCVWQDSCWKPCWDSCNFASPAVISQVLFACCCTVSWAISPNYGRTKEACLLSWGPVLTYHVYFIYSSNTVPSVESCCAVPSRRTPLWDLVADLVAAHKKEWCSGSLSDMMLCVTSVVNVEIPQGVLCMQCERTVIGIWTPVKLLFWKLSAFFMNLSLVMSRASRSG